MNVPLRIMSDYSLLKSLILLPTIIPIIKKMGYTACGICDENLFGVMEFYDLCLANDIKPVIGLQVDILNNKVSLYAKNYEGYLNLLKIHTICQKKENILNYKEYLTNNLLVILDVSNINFYKELTNYFAENNIYIGYQNITERNNALLVSKQVVFAPFIKAIKDEDVECLDVLKAIDKNELLEDIDKGSYLYQTLSYFKDSYDIDDNSSGNFSLLCDVVIPKNKRYIPKYPIEVDSFEYLVALAKKGLMKRLNNQVTEEYVKRLKYELDVIKSMGFVDYFLIVYDYVKYAKQNDILVGLGRGSAAGSLVSYSLGITDVNPVKYQLLFERFLNPERVTMPDIDIDFENTRREEVVRYVKNKYGQMNVANIITFGTLKSKLVLRSIFKVYNLNPVFVDEFIGLLDSNLTLKENLQLPSVKEVIRKDSSLIPIIKQALIIEGLKKHISVHAAGVVICSVPIDEVIPITYSDNELLTGVGMNYLEELGILKMDFLSIKNLTTISNILKLIYENTGEKINLNKIDYNDKRIMKMFSEGDTSGIFQFESEGMKGFLRKLKPDSLHEIINAIALYRPGPMENIDTYIRRKEKKEEVSYLHPSLEVILKETYGIIVYQEQIMQILVKVANYSFAEADIVRRAMSKKKKEILKSGKEDFIKRAVLNNYPQEIAEEIYDLILKFANYGFNKAHSVSYSMIGVQMAYLKCYYPIYFLIHLLNMSVSSSIKTQEYLTLARKYQIEILPPNVNFSGEFYQIENKKLRLPLSIIKNLGGEGVKCVLEPRDYPYKDYCDFVNRTFKRGINRKTIEALIKAGALDLFGLNHNTLKDNMENVLDYARLAMGEEQEELKPILDIKEDLSDNEKRQEEYEAYGFFIRNHPSAGYQGKQIMKLKMLEQNFDKYVTCVVLIEKIRKLKTKTNENMAFITASDETDSKSFVLFKEEFKMLSDIKVGDLCIVNGRVTKRFAEYQINVNKIEKIHKEV